MLRFTLETSGHGSTHSGECVTATTHTVAKWTWNPLLKLCKDLLYSWPHLEPLRPELDSPKHFRLPGVYRCLLDSSWYWTNTEVRVLILIGYWMLGGSCTHRWLVAPPARQAHFPWQQSAARCCGDSELNVTGRRKRRFHREVCRLGPAEDIQQSKSHIKVPQFSYASSVVIKNWVHCVITALQKLERTSTFMWE